MRGTTRYGGTSIWPKLVLHERRIPRFSAFNNASIGGYLPFFVGKDWNRIMPGLLDRAANQKLSGARETFTVDLDGDDVCSGCKNCLDVVNAGDAGLDRIFPSDLVAVNGSLKGIRSGDL